LVLQCLCQKQLLMWVRGARLRLEPQLLAATQRAGMPPEFRTARATAPWQLWLVFRIPLLLLFLARPLLSHSPLWPAVRVFLRRIFSSTSVWDLGSMTFLIPLK